MKILVIFTGGTIGSGELNGYITPREEAKYTLINKYREKFGDDTRFSFKEPYRILSENLSGDVLTKLMECLAESISGDEDGVIVTHGTDTLQYSAAAAAFCLGRLKKPLIFVSANYPLDNKESNGHINFEGAVELIRYKPCPGVYVSYSNDLKTVLFHSGSKILRHMEFSDKIYSLNGPLYEYVSGKIKKVGDEKDVFCDSSVKKAIFLNDPKILRIAVSPLENYNYSLDGINAVVLTPYHSGTLNTDNACFKAFCSNAKKKSIPVILTGVSKYSEYASMACYDALGIRVLFDITATSAEIKLWLEISEKEHSKKD